MVRANCLMYYHTKSHQNLANCIIVHGSSEMEGRGRIPSQAMNVTSATLEKSLQGGKQSDSVKSTVVIILKKKNFLILQLLLFLRNVS